MAASSDAKPKARLGLALMFLLAGLIPLWAVAGTSPPKPLLQIDARGCVGEEYGSRAFENPAPASACTKPIPGAQITLDDETIGTTDEHGAIRIEGLDANQLARLVGVSSKSYGGFSGIPLSVAAAPYGV